MNARATSISTRFTDLVGCSLPLQLAALGGVGTAALATAVTEAGGFGMVPGFRPPPGCGVNFLMPFIPDLDHVRAAADGARVVEFFYGEPDKRLVDAVHSRGALAGWQVGSAAEAVAAAERGCDYVVAQGVDAGGHVRGTELLDDVLPAVLAAVDIPVVAAGGVSTARRFRDVMANGADAVRVGTRFVVSPECDAHPEYVAALLAARGEDTVVTEWFDTDFPHAPHRVLRQCVDRARASGWRKTDPPSRGITRTPRDMAMYAGSGVGDVTSVMPAAEVVADLVRLL